MLDPDGLYELVDPGELPELDRPVLIQALSGFVDAGNGTRLAREHLLAELDARQVAEFDIDQLLDYRSRRPMMTFVEDRFTRYDAPHLALHLVRDAGGTGFLLLSGPEPDLQWERFIAAVSRLIGRFNVRLTVGLNSIPMAVPHTRPAGVTSHATRPELLAAHDPWLQRVQVPGSAGNLLEYRLGEGGRDAIGFAVHVPHYLAQAEYPDAAELLLGSVSRASGLLLPTEKLRTAGELTRAAVDRQVEADAEASALVKALEEQYDAFLRGRGSANLLAPQAGLPTAEELGAELERFLAEQPRNDPPAGS
ncbi:proteasome assembly chaperone family protein [Rhizomonospora bruguierae]|uniref:proteasome assembly chaperone family protein n=1 Tax=Rhizomonospora bruguierae TaxID=1581705 RepID=UPI001BCF0BBA|nr:PAC2 family protein [Micromonospora sp. NBRC 107566]